MDENAAPENQDQEFTPVEDDRLQAVLPEDGHSSADGTPVDNDPVAGSLTVTVQPNAQEFREPALPYPVVAFGASAGGLAALREVLENLDPATGMAFVVVTHLSPDDPSLLTEILANYTRMPVVHADSGMRAEPNHVYILQPNQLLTIHNGLLHTEPRQRSNHHLLVIDTFMRSLASDQKNHAIGVVLSGADSDGALA